MRLGVERDLARRAAQASCSRSALSRCRPWRPRLTMRALGRVARRRAARLVGVVDEPGVVAEDAAVSGREQVGAGSGGSIGRAGASENSPAGS
ncbi:MAG: hypothetical protein MZV70_52815 [Desulfobacterales bacterium]|nr:hypothetical protein [Desulfobacterales bacterium]